MIAVLLFFTSLVASAQICDIPGIDQTPNVKVYYQKVIPLGTEVPQEYTSDVIHFRGNVDPKKIDLEGTEISRTNESITMTETTYLSNADNIVPGSFTFRPHSSTLLGRLEGEPQVVFDESQRLATVTATLKYARGDYNNQEVKVSGVVVFKRITPVDEDVLLPATFAYEGALDYTSGKIEPVTTNKNRVGELDSPDRIVIRDAETDCIWYDGKLENSNFIARAVLPEGGNSNVSLQGKPLVIKPYVSDNLVTIEISER
jgi:hypothetical protein